jgi:hypothetical protein
VEDTLERHAAGAEEEMTIQSILIHWLSSACDSSSLSRGKGEMALQQLPHPQASSPTVAALSLSLHPPLSRRRGEEDTGAPI